MNVNPGSDTESSQRAEQAEFGPRKRSSSPKVKVKAKAARTSSSSTRKESKALSPWVAELRSWFITLAIAAVVVLCLNVFVFNLSTVKGQSMEPTLYEKEWLFVNKATYLMGSPKQGDVVILKDPSNGIEHKEYLVKRIIGMPGDSIEIREGQLYRNGKLVVESYTDIEIEDSDYGPETVTADHYFVMGDNRHNKASRDSRSFQAVPRDMILGRADYILWPISKLNHL
ncbi:signal peptidase I [Paenibacillus lignilyticus]|uniref:Signal peptidase I n=1 Tax=Paenibacillus lignilyticus TaxID=1172615 RepID=A0ABS5CMD1_9BACL|nr:signal peptidase I [Paenibacillus lignilyticus]MBP3967001.1 signal peptidase I [Paenibacillus lignilyticus]